MKNISSDFQEQNNNDQKISKSPLNIENYFFFLRQ